MRQQFLFEMEDAFVPEAVFLEESHDRHESPDLAFLPLLHGRYGCGWRVGASGLVLAREEWCVSRRGQGSFNESSDVYPSAIDVTVRERLVNDGGKHAMQRRRGVRSERTRGVPESREVVEAACCVSGAALNVHDVRLRVAARSPERRYDVHSVGPRGKKVFLEGPWVARRVACMTADGPGVQQGALWVSHRGRRVSLGACSVFGRRSCLPPRGQALMPRVLRLAGESPRVSCAASRLMPRDRRVKDRASALDLTCSRAMLAPQN